MADPTTIRLQQLITTVPSLIAQCSEMESTSEAEWQRTCDTGDKPLRTPRWLCEDYVAHLEHHLRQIIAHDL